MNEGLDILNKINWFLKPIANFVWFLFSNPTGQLLLLAGFAAFLILPAFDAVRVRTLNMKAASNFGSGRISIFEKIYVFISAVAKNFTKIVSNAPTLLVSLLLLLLVVGMSKGIDGINKFAENQKRIKELTTVIKQLDQRYKVAEVTITDRNPKSDTTKLSIRFFDNSLNQYLDKKQDLILRGGIIYFDAMILNFDYSEITGNEKKNLVLPYRIFTNAIPPNKGIALNIKDEKGIPYIYKRNNKEVYGMEIEEYNSCLQEFATYLTDEEAARKAGIRNYNGGNAVHTFSQVKAGQKFTIWVEQTGGLVIKESEDF